MEDVAEDQSHYEISLTAGQAFAAFVLLLLSLAASFAFGLLIGKGQSDERLIVRREPAVIKEGNLLPGRKSDGGRIVELGVSADDFKQKTSSAAQVVPTPLVEDAPVVDSSTSTAAAASSAQVDSPPPAAVAEKPPAPVHVAETPKPVVHPAVEAPKPVAVAAAVQGGPVYAQLLSTGDQKTAESLAARLIDRGYTSAYVERGAATGKGLVYRVRIRFNSDAEARAAEGKLKEFSRDVWITH